MEENKKKEVIRCGTCHMPLYLAKDDPSKGKVVESDSCLAKLGSETTGGWLCNECLRNSPGWGAHVAVAFRKHYGRIGR